MGEEDTQIPDHRATPQDIFLAHNRVAKPAAMLANTASASVLELHLKVGGLRDEDRAKELDGLGRREPNHRLVARLAKAPTKVPLIFAQFDPSREKLGRR